MTDTFRLELVPSGIDDPPRPVVHMESHWDDCGPWTQCGIRAPRVPDGEPHRQTMTESWGRVTCSRCLTTRYDDDGRCLACGRRGGLCVGPGTDECSDYIGIAVEVMDPLMALGWFLRSLEDAR